MQVQYNAERGRMMYGEPTWIDKATIVGIALMIIGLLGLVVEAIISPDTRPIECIQGYKYRIGSHGEMYIIKDKYGPRKCK